MYAEPLNFNPAIGMSNSHVQTIFGRIISTIYHKDDLLFQEEILDLEDGDFLELAWHPRRSDTKNSPVIIIFPGLGGNLMEGPQYKELLENISMAGWRGLFVHFRGCGQKKSDSPKVYNTADTSQITAVINYLETVENNMPIAAIGVSAGGALLAKWLEEPKNQKRLKCNILISPAFDIGAVSAQTNWYIPYYLNYFLKPYRATLVAKFARIHDKRVNIERLKNVKSMLELDDVLHKIYGCHSVQDYYARCKLDFSKIVDKVFIIHDQNDPLVPQQSIPAKDIEKNAANIKLYLTQAGGHGGFIGKGTLLKPFQFWIGPTVVGLLKQDLPSKPLQDRKKISNQSKSFFWRRAKKDIRDISYALLFLSIVLYIDSSLKNLTVPLIVMPTLFLLKKIINLSGNLYKYANADEKNDQMILRFKSA